MKRIFLTTAMMWAILHSHAQTKADTTAFSARKLKVDEINLVSSYYGQDGDNAAVTGGIGSEKLTDIANVVSIKMVKYDKRKRKHIFDGELGMDHYTSASSDRVDLKANSSASHADTRFYPTVHWTTEDPKNKKSYGVGLSYSTEFDYQSVGLNVGLSTKTKNNNGEFDVKLQAYLDKVAQVIPIELRPQGTGSDEEEHYPNKSRNTYAATFSYSHIVNKNFQIALLADVVQQQGYLSLPFHRVYFSDGTVHQENLPNKRFKLPLGMRANYFIGDKLILRTYYRYYHDNWGITAHTMDVELPIKISSFFSLSPYYRYYTQSAANYFAPYRNHINTNTYYTSNYDLSKFNSQFFGAGVRLVPPKGVFNIQRLNTLEIRYGHYTRTTGLNANIVSMNVKFK